MVLSVLGSECKGKREMNFFRHSLFSVNLLPGFKLNFKLEFKLKGREESWKCKKSKFESKREEKKFPAKIWVGFFKLKHMSGFQVDFKLKVIPLTPKETNLGRSITNFAISSIRVNRFFLKSSTSKNFKLKIPRTDSRRETRLFFKSKTFKLGNFEISKTPRPPLLKSRLVILKKFRFSSWRFGLIFKLKIYLVFGNCGTGSLEQERIVTDQFCFIRIPAIFLPSLNSFVQRHLSSWIFSSWKLQIHVFFKLKMSTSVSMTRKSHVTSLIFFIMPMRVRRSAKFLMQGFSRIAKIWRDFMLSRNWAIYFSSWKMDSKVESWNFKEMKEY